MVFILTNWVHVWDILFQFSDMTRYPQGFVAFGFAAAEQMGSVLSDASEARLSCRCHL